MKHFELNKYLRNNPLLKESTNENLSILDDETPIKEAQLDPVNQELKNKYIEDYMTLLISPEAPDYDDEIADVDDIEAHAQEFGYEDTLRTMDKRFSSEFDGRGIPHGGFDPLQGKVVGNYDRTTGTYRREPVITKKGKMHKYDVDFLKKKIKSNLGLDQ